MGLRSIWHEDKDHITKDLNFLAIELELETNYISILKRILNQQVSHFHYDSSKTSIKNIR